MASILLSLAACGSTKTFDAAGKISVSGAHWDGSGTMTCEGVNGFDDMQVGVQVVIRNSAEKIIGNGSVESTTWDYANKVCDLAFTVPDVPVQKDDIYTIEVSHRGEITFKQSEAGSLALTLG